MTIYSLQRTMDYVTASRRLRASGARRWLIGPLRAIAEVYIPYCLYRVTIEDGRSHKIHSQLIAVDAAAGTLDPYQFATPSRPEAFVEVETRNVHPVRLDHNETEKLVIEKVRRSVYGRGFFRVSNPTFTAELINREFYIPYWVGFYGHQDKMSVIVLNAIRQTFEGSKMRRLVEHWLLEPEKAEPTSSNKEMDIPQSVCHADRKSIDVNGQSSRWFFT